MQAPPPRLTTRGDPLPLTISTGRRRQRGREPCITVVCRRWCQRDNPRQRHRWRPPSQARLCPRCDGSAHHCREATECGYPCRAQPHPGRVPSRGVAGAFHCAAGCDGCRPRGTRRASDGQHRTGRRPAWHLQLRRRATCSIPTIASGSISDGRFAAARKQQVIDACGCVKPAADDTRRLRRHDRSSRLGWRQMRTCVELRQMSGNSLHIVVGPRCGPTARPGGHP